MKMRAPFPWFGGKNKVAEIIWEHFGDVANYVEPFAGSLAVLLQRPHEPRTETVNDADCYLSNFWRALAHDPIGVAEWSDWPVNEADLHARHVWLLSRSEFRERMMSDPDYYDVKVAGWWVWGQCAWIGSGWCDSKYYHLGDAGMGINRPSQQLPHLGNAGMGINRPSQKLPHLGNAGRGDVYDYFAHLSARLRRVRVACGDWSRIVGDSVTWRHGVTGVLLDPPYAQDERQSDLYANDGDVSEDVRAWAVENGDNPLLRIALCGYAGEHDMPEGWLEVAWKNRGGYGSQGNTTGRENSSRERIWFSPHCLGLRQRSLFDLPVAVESSAMDSR